jgi:hypothetical protein
MQGKNINDIQACSIRKPFKLLSGTTLILSSYPYPENI